MEKKVTKSQRSTHFFIFIIRFHQFFPPISSCCHLISSVFLTYFWILSVWIDRFSPTHLFISTYLFYHSLSSVFPTGVFIYHLIPSVFPTYFLMLPWVFFNFPDLFIHVVHHFQPFSLPDPSLYHSIPSMFPTYVIWSLDVTNFPTISVFYHLPSSIFRPISSFFISIGFKKNRDAFYHWTSWVVLSFFHCLDVWWFSNFFVFFWRPSVCRNPTPTKHSSLGCLDMHRFQKRAAPGDQPMPRISFQNVHGPRCEPWCWYIKTYKTRWFWMFGQMLVNIPAPWSIWGGFFSLSMFVRYFHVFTVLIFFPPVYRCLHGFS